ncbi:MAG TPA: peptide deformylase [Oscillatoriaceae cyanobacterium M33_DOE_052]|uniref:Peptide deformylase n=1 Tax=Planktothricoides sp. SpSt-374 TaxID=2282167 RepID=A0A7C3ZZC8_9CYAN|nr:peptide deformylase [Oscillatoriaceae cyanobacterium M33_DOE_052]
MTQTREIIQLGNPILRSPALPVENPLSEPIQTLIDDLITTGVAANGVGIAAPQVAQSYCLVVIASRPTLRYPHAPFMEPTPMLNPQIISHSSEVVKGWEGCLSVPGIRGLVPRYQAIEVEYTDRFGQRKRQELTDFVARIFQHEYDHLSGKVFLDRVETTLDLITEQEYQKQLIA